MRRAPMPTHQRFGVMLSLLLRHSCCRRKIVVDSQGQASSSAEPDQNGYPETLTMGHLETAVRILAMLARGAGAGGGSGGGSSFSTFDERLDLLLQAHYFLGRMAAMVADTVEHGRRYRLYDENVAEGAERTRTPFQEWWDAHGEAAGKRPT